MITPCPSTRSPWRSARCEPPTSRSRRTILELPAIYINGGARGFLVALDPREVERVLRPVLVDVAVQSLATSHYNHPHQ
jgi:hypothetical protein